ncbi:MAG: MauE/DoxX family redox-associated membrane protein [Ktedonobacteraceae bacterium]
MIYLLLFCQIVLACTLLIAASGKIFQSNQFLAALRLTLPEPVIIPLAIVVPTIEIGLSIGLILTFPFLLMDTFVAIIVLLVSFTAWMVFVFSQGLHIQCGCFGTSSATIGSRSILRNMLLLLVAIGGFLLSRNVQSILPQPSIWMSMITISCAMGIMLLRSFQQARPALALSFAALLQAQEENAD